MKFEHSVARFAASLLATAALVSCGGSQRNGGGSGASDSSDGDATSPRIELVSGAKVLAFHGSGGAGPEVVLVPITIDSEPRYLVRVIGANSEIDRVIAVAERVNDKGGDYFFAITWRGGHQGGLWFLADQFRSDGGTWEFYTPEGRSAPVIVDETAAKAVDAQALLDRHLRQRADGSYGKFADFDRAFHVARNDKSLAEAVDKARKECGAFDAKIDYSGISDEIMANKLVANPCRTVIYNIAHLCEEAPHVREAVVAAAPLLCKYPEVPKGSEWGLRESPSGTVYTPVADLMGEIDVEIRRFFGELRTVLRSDERYFVIDATNKEHDVYSGLGTKLSKQRRYGGGGGHYILWGGAQRADLTRDKSGKWSLQCGKTKTALEMVLGDERKAFLDSAELTEQVWKREPYVLARDSRGTYYYVDRYTEKFGGKRYRVFIGPRGRQKLSKLKGVVDDAKGTIFATERGKLRLIVNTRGPFEALWIRGSREPKRLETVPLRDSAKLIYDELGAYTGERLGHVCE